MQSEETEDTRSSLKLEPEDITMTYSNTIDLSSSKANKPSIFDDFKSLPSTDFKLEGIDFEADIEKMMPESSDTEDETRNELPIIYKPTTDVLKSLQEQNPNESIRSWLQRITQMQNDIKKKLNEKPASFIETATKNTITSTQIQTPNRVVKYQDLPYMGEMTLDNSKPRRGRKPKKADICHLIYKNYGTIFPGTPNAKSIVDRDKKTSERLQENAITAESFNRSDVQNRIISSLLEKRLTQESKRHREALATKSKTAQNEPLNLCVRDLDSLKIRLTSKDGNLEIKSEPLSDDDVEFVHETPSPASTVNDFKFPALPEGFGPPVLPPDAIKVPENGVAPNGYVFWPNAGVFIHPMALQQQLMYYQKLTTNNNYASPSRPTPAATPEPAVPELRKLVPKQVKAKKIEDNHEVKAKRNTAAGGDKVPAKRKRSAIFIPPIQSENQTNPSTEVSICKFKFTGGAKPSLQEKKMLSVDSGGNFRYYSGTGDKSMRGYEFFPRETLQQQIGNAQGSSTGAFLQASGEKIYPSSSPIDFNGKANEFMLTPEIQPPVPQTPDAMTPRNKKRKSRKSLQREKLEQTFKEKGFLIQTQQLESAEGATYCKFRQLRKFTRYLFRSWKDYLPGNVEGNATEAIADKPEIDEITDQDIIESSLETDASPLASPLAAPPS